MGMWGAVPKGHHSLSSAVSNTVSVLGTSQTQSYRLKIEPRASPMLSCPPILMHS